MVTHIVQAWGTEIGWVDCCKASSVKKARVLEMELLYGNGWMPQTTNRQTRIVPVEEANCKYNEPLTQSTI